MAFLSAVPHFPDEDPDQPEPRSETAHDEVEGEVENAVALARHDVSFQEVSGWKSGDIDRPVVKPSWPAREPHPLRLRRIETLTSMN
jgi:hypothetical protein